MLSWPCHVSTSHAIAFLELPPNGNGPGREGRTISHPYLIVMYAVLQLALLEILFTKASG